MPGSVLFYDGEVISSVSPLAMFTASSTYVPTVRVCQSPLPERPVQRCHYYGRKQKPDAEICPGCGAPARKPSRIPGAVVVPEVEIIDQEIQWCLTHPSTNLSRDFQRGFVAGLKQSKELLKKQSRHRHTWLYTDILHRYCKCGVKQTWGFAK